MRECGAIADFTFETVTLGLLCTPRSGMFVRKSLEAEFMHACGSSSSEQKQCCCLAGCIGEDASVPLLYLNLVKAVSRANLGLCKAVIHFMPC